MPIGAAIAATDVLMSSYDSTVSTTTTPSITAVEIGTVITNNRRSGYEKTTYSNQAVSIPLEIGLNTITFKAPNKLPIVMQFHRT